MGEGDLIPLPEPWLDAEAYRDLNGSFYGAVPHEYFATRLELLMLYAAEPARLEEILTAGIEYRGLKFGRDTHQSTGDEEFDVELDARRHLSFVITEAVTLLHYLGETLLRLYLAHAPNALGEVPPAPWLKVAGLTSAKAFKERVRKRFDGEPLTDRRRHELATVFYSSREAVGPDHGDALEESMVEIERWLQHFAEQFLEDAAIFNSLKHGLTVLAGESSIRFGTEDSPILNHDGPSVRYLERGGPEWIWGYKNRWFDVDYLMVEGRTALVLLQLIGQVGRARYLGEPVGKVEMLREGHFAQFGDPRVRNRWLKQIGYPVGYRYAYQPPLVCTACGRQAQEGEDLSEWKAKRRPDRYVDPFCPECAAAPPDG
jgi:hypothetical protein